MRRQAVLDDAAREAHDWLAARYEASFSPYYEGGHWARPGSRELIEGQATFFAKPDVYPVDVRGVTFSYAYFTPKHPGGGSSYLLTIADKDGRLLDGGTTYRLTVPPNVPVKQYWPATVYDRATHAPIREARWPSRSSQTPGLQTNADGSADVYFGPKPRLAKSPTGCRRTSPVVRGALSLLRSREAAVREDMAAAGHREGVMTTVQNASQKIDTRVGTLEFTHDFANGYPTDATVEKLYDERDFQRACQAYL
jgi:hypothetical protein